MRNADKVQGIAYMEAVITSRRWEDFPNGRDKLFRTLRVDEAHRLVMEDKYFVETVLPKGIMRELLPEEMEAYRGPFRAEQRSRLPTLV